MPPAPDRRARPQLTLRQVGVLVAFSAVAMAVLAPLSRTASGPGEFALEASTGLPYALLIPTLLLVRRGPIKNWMTVALCVVPLAGLLAYLNYVAVATLGVLDALLQGDVGFGLLIIGVADAMLLGSMLHMGRRLIPGTCPNCLRRATLHDPSVPRFRDFPGSRHARTCLACGSHFRRARRGPWVEVGPPARSPSPAP